jgi:HEAT repeat protein
LRDQDDRVRLFAITAMGESANPKARVLLNELAKSPDPRVRQAAAQSLRNLDGE